VYLSETIALVYYLWEIGSVGPTVRFIVSPKLTTKRYTLPGAVICLLFSGACTTAHPPQPREPAMTQEEVASEKIETQENILPEEPSPENTLIAENERRGEQQPKAENSDEIVDYDAIQQDALDLCQSAEEFLDQGDLDNSLDAVDHAYELMLKLPQNHDEQYLQAREDIRRLISKIIQKAYSAPSASLNPAHSFDLGLALVENEKVKREIKSFSTAEKESFLAAYRRSGRYRSMILEKLAEAGLPSRLSWLPLVESNFKVKAYSRASALGLWQFIASTGQRYGLSRNAWIDEHFMISSVTGPKPWPPTTAAKPGSPGSRGVIRISTLISGTSTTFFPARLVATSLVFSQHS